jgi:succinyl-CoA synthetase beta subunit
VGLDGYVGIIANGAGLAMSTCDVVNQVGGAPANFLDIGGGANAEVMANALEVINSDPNVRPSSSTSSAGSPGARKWPTGSSPPSERVDINAPMVIRLDGTNAEEGREILKTVESDRVISSPTMLEAARKAVELAGSGTSGTGSGTSGITAGTSGGPGASGETAK